MTTQGGAGNFFQFNTDVDSAFYLFHSCQVMLNVYLDRKCEIDFDLSCFFQMSL